MAINCGHRSISIAINELDLPLTRYLMIFLHMIVTPSIQNLQFEAPRGWIEERVVRATRGGKSITWVKGHSGVIGNELADWRAKQGVWEGRAMGKPDIATAGGIHHPFRLTLASAQVKNWDREALKRHTYIYTDKDPFRLRQSK